MGEVTNVAVIGCGNISNAYFTAVRRFPNLRLAACADIDRARAEAKAAEHDVVARSVEQVLADPEIGIAINLTIPAAHAAVDQQIIAAGKSVYSEKPLALDRADGARILDAAAVRGVRVGCAPDTFLGGGLQTCRELIDGGTIGRPLAATAFMLCHGHESWHPDPVFYYRAGGGPLFDMGPYYLTACVALLGPVRRVTGSARISFPQRTITSEPRRGTVIEVEVPTQVTGILEFDAGCVATLTTSFDVWAAEVPRIEIYGSEGTLQVPDPNGFGGPVRVWERTTGAWRDVPITRSYTANWRGLGVADMAASIVAGRPHRASGEMAYHVLEIMDSMLEASESGRRITLESTCDRPAPLPPSLDEGELEA